VSRFADAFSLRKNLADVVHRAGDALAPLDGLRAIAVLWVMLFHCFTIPTVQWASAGNMLRFLDEPALNVAFSGHMGVEIFLVLSGFLMGHLLLREADKTGELRFVPFVRRRFWRIVPVYAAAIAAHMIVEPAQRAACTRWGWANLLFLNNFVGDQLNARACLMHTWSIAVEFHLYLLAPFVVRWMLAPRFSFRGIAREPEKRWGLWAPAILMIAGSAIVAAIVLRNHTRPLSQWYLTTLYDKTYARSTPFFSGLAAAYLHHTRDPSRPRSPLRHVAHALAIVTVLAIAYLGAGEHPSRYLPWHVDHHPYRNLFLLLFARQLLGLGVAVILYATLSGDLRLVNKALSARVWVPFARLSYAAYLVEFVCMIPLYSLWSRGYATAPSFPDLVPVLAANGAVAVVTSFAVAVPFYVLVEKPFVNLR
jgi:peptidoglycan/LPS O-acetylase OafA/YrhL